MATSELYATYLNYFAIDDQLTDWDQSEGDLGERCPVGNASNLGLVAEQWSKPHDRSSTLLMVYERPSLIKLGSVGCAGDNKPYCRLCLDRNDGMLVCIFQPFMMMGLDKFSAAALATALLSTSDEEAALDTQCQKTAAKIMWTMKKVFDRRPVNLKGEPQDDSYAGVLIKKGDYDMLTQWSYQTCISLKGHMKTGLGQTTAETGGMMGFIVQVAQAWGVQKVMCTGFSLGAGLSVPASLLLKHAGVPEIGTVTCCGEASTNARGAEVMAEYALSARNMVVYNDAVSGVSGPWVHPSPTLVFHLGGSGPEWNPLRRSRSEEAEVGAARASRRGKRQQRVETLAPKLYESRDPDTAKLGGRFTMMSPYTVHKPSGQFYSLLWDQGLGDGNFRSAIKGILSGTVGAVSSGLMGAVTGSAPSMAAMASAPVTVPFTIGMISSSSVLIPLGAGGAVTAYLGAQSSEERNFKRYHLSAQYLVPLALWENFVTLMPHQAYQNEREQVAFFAQHGLGLRRPLSDPKWCAWFDSNSYAKKYGVCPPEICQRLKQGDMWRCLPKQGGPSGAMGEGENIDKQLGKELEQTLWTQAVFGGDWSALEMLDCGAVQHPHEPDPVLYAMEDAGVCSRQDKSDNCAQFAIINSTGQNLKMRGKSSFEDVIEALGDNGVLLYTCLNTTKGPRKPIPHLIFVTSGKRGGVEPGFLAPYCMTAGKPVGGERIPLGLCDDLGWDKIAKWMQTYSTFILLFEHYLGYPQGHYISVKKEWKGWYLNDSGSGQIYKLQSDVALALLIRGSVAVIAINPGSSCVVM